MKLQRTVMQKNKKNRFLGTVILRNRFRKGKRKFQVRKCCFYKSKIRFILLDLFYSSRINSKHGTRIYQREYSSVSADFAIKDSLLLRIFFRI